MSKVLIVGATSALARTVIHRLAADHEIVTAGRSGCDVPIDLTQPITIPNGTEVVVNFAAAFGGQDDEAIIDTIQTNVEGVLRLCMAAKQAGVHHFIQISSTSATHSSDSPYYSDYAITKRQGDELLTWYCGRNQLSLTILRPSQLYGNDPLFAKHQPFFYQIIDCAERGEDVTIFGAHDALRNYLHADDFSEVVARVLDRKAGGVFPCLYPENVTYSAIAATAQQVFGKGGEIVYLKDKPDTPDNVFPMDLSVYGAVDYKPQITLEKGIQALKTFRTGGGE